MSSPGRQDQGYHLRIMVGGIAGRWRMDVVPWKVKLGYTQSILYNSTLSLMLFWNTMPENLKRLHGVRGKLNCWIAPMAGWILCQIQSSRIFTKSLWFDSLAFWEKKLWQPTWDRNWDSQHNMPRQAVLIKVCKFAAPQPPRLAARLNKLPGIFYPWKLMAGRRVSFWDAIFSGANC